MSQPSTRSAPHAKNAATPPTLGKQLGLRANDALIVVDVQRDFLPGGALAVPEGDEIIPRVNAYMAAFAARELPIVMTRDWHPSDHCSFKARGGIWPPHCVRETPGADWPTDLQVPPSARIVSKALEKNQEAYSGFEGTSLASLLRDQKIKRVFVCGLATDYCVRATVLDARKHGFQVVVLDDAVRGVEVKAGDSTRALADMAAQGATLFQPASQASAKRPSQHA